MADRRPALKSTPVMLAHIILILLGWIVFFAFWAKVLWRDYETAKHAGLLILIALFAAPLITLVWVMYNQRLHRRKGARGAGFSPPEVYEKDWSGRSVFAEFPLLKATRNVEVISAETVKLYKPFNRISQAVNRGNDRKS